VEPPKAESFIKYVHHGINMWVRNALKGKHRLVCCCYHCDKFHPGKENNCPIAQALYEFDVDNSVTTPVWECEGFEFTDTPDVEETK